MKFVVVYESMFGNTETIAEAIAAGLSEAGEVPTAWRGGTRTRPSPGNGRTDDTDPSNRDTRASVGGSSD